MNIIDALTPAQSATLAKLLARGYCVNHINQYHDEPAPTIFLSRKPRHYTTLYAEIGPDASVNGVPVEEFIKTDK